MKVFFDVGANDGFDSLSYARNNPEAKVYAFEPNPYMIELLEKESKDLQNYIILPLAVSDYEGVSNFNICTDKQGLCSLLDWGKDAKNIWPQFGLDFQEKIDVKVIKLETFIEDNNIKKIDYFHCDTQGSDLRVLKGLGKYINIIEEGQVEATNRDNSLYENQNTKKETVEFLMSKGFEVLGFENQIHFNECNIKFKNLSLKFKP
jgi:FkbM family methyltransferase